MFEFLLDLSYKFALIALLVFANAFFVASEFAFVNVRKTRIEQLKKEGSPTAQIISGELANIEKFIASVQLGITLASLGLGWVGESTLAGLFYPFFNFLSAGERLITTHTLSAIIAFTLISVLHVVLGELTPKSIALQYSEKIALLVARPMFIIRKIFTPFIYILNGLGNSLLKTFNIPEAKGIHLVHSVEELDMLVSASYQEGILNETERDMLHNMFKFSDLIARQIAVPRLDMICVPKSISLEEFIKFMQENQFTRYPVYDNDLDHIMGIIHIKDIIPFIEEKEKFSIPKIIRKVMFIPETLTIDRLLIEFKKRHGQMAIVIDEFGVTSGLVTLEDVLEEILGDVQDEFDVEEADIKTISDNEYLVNAKLRIDQINELLDLDISEEEIETIGGLILKKLGRLANAGDKVKIADFDFIVDSVEGARITKLKIQKL